MTLSDHERPSGEVEPAVPPGPGRGEVQGGAGQAAEGQHIGEGAAGQVEGQRPAVLVCHEGPGLDDHAKQRALRLAGLGYVAFALDYHGGGKPVPMDQFVTGHGAHMSDPNKTRAIGQAGLEVLL